MMKPAIPLLAATLAAALSVSCALAQTQPSAPRPATEPAAKPVSEPAVPKPNVDFVERTFLLKNVSQASEANEVFTTLRQLMPPNVKSFLVPSENAIVVHGSPDDIALVQKVIDELDRPKKAYRLTYTVSEMDGAKRIGVEHFAMIAAAGQLTTLKQGSRVPVATGPRPSTGPATQFSYMDVGTNFEATLEPLANGAMLRSRVESSGLVEAGPDASVQEPVIRNTQLEGSAFLSTGKPTMLGSVDIPGSSRRLDIEVVMDQLP